jgi:hypothetical protein
MINKEKAIFGGGPQTFAFSLIEGFHGAELADMGMINIGKEQGGRMGDFNETAGFSREVHAEFKDSSFVVRAQAKYGLGKSDEVIKISRGSMGRAMVGCENVAEHFLRGGFAGGSAKANAHLGAAVVGIDSIEPQIGQLSEGV